MEDQFLGYGTVWKRRLAGKQEVEQAAQAVDIRTNIHSRVVCLLGSQIVGRAQDRVGIELAGQGFGMVRNSANPKSRIFTIPFRSRIRLLGFISLWTNLESWACCRPGALGDVIDRPVNA